MNKKWSKLVLSLGIGVGVLAQTVLASNYYVDPLAGNMANPGTSAAPWSTLQDVFNAGKIFATGDVIYLRRGYHGGPIIRGKNLGAVTITAQEGHAPIMKWVKFSAAKNWILKDIFINPQVDVPDAQGSLIEFLSTSESNVISNCAAFSTQHPLGWQGDQASWLRWQKTGLNLASGSLNIIEKLHLLNVGNAMIVGTAKNRIDSNVIENFSRDGMVANGNENVWQYNLVMNAIIADENGPTNPVHRDFFQSWNGAKIGMVMRGNVMISSTDPSKTYIDRRIPVFALWDGPFRNYLIENNVIFTDNGAGIWMNAGTNCTIVNNTLSRINSASAQEWPTIHIGQKTANSGKSSKNYLYNNIADGYYLTNMDGSAVLADQSNNISVKRTAYGSYYMAQAQPKADVHLLATASGAIGKGNMAKAPSLDADQKERKLDQKVDIGAYEYSSTLTKDITAPTVPGAPRAIRVAGFGVDLAWTASSDNRKVAGYDIYFNGQLIGRGRVGARFFDVRKVAAAGSYTIVAFDYTGNRSQPSLPGQI